MEINSNDYEQIERIKKLTLMFNKMNDKQIINCALNFMECDLKDLKRKGGVL